MNNNNSTPPLNDPNKYRELDKSITKEVMAEFKGKVIECVCPHCKGDDPKCEDCNGTGSINYQY